MEVRKFRPGVLAVLLLLVLTASVCLATEYVLVQDGRSAFSLYREEGAPSSVKLAAEEIQEYILKATGMELPITSRPSSPMICLGDCAEARRAGFSVADLPLEGFRIATRDGNIYIHGPDTEDGGQTDQGGGSRGTLFGAYTFLEKFLGIRWLIPGETGEVVPQAATIVLPDVLLTDSPDFLRRRIPYIQNGRKEVKRWSLRNKLGESMALFHSHNWRRPIPASLYEEHPDWFAMRDGKRVPPVGRYKLCTTNPELIRAFADAAITAFEQRPALYAFSLSPSDSAGWCECDNCTALDEIDPRGDPSLTRRILTFYNEVARQVRPRFPDRILCGYIYSRYVFPPEDRSMRLEPNLFLVWAPSFDYGFTLFRPELRKQWDDALAAWTSMTQNIAYYDLCVNLIQEAGAPNPPGVKILKHIFPRLKHSGMKGLYLYGVSAWGHAGLLNYMLAKLSWDADADVDALFDEFCDMAYGNGAGEMKHIYQLLDADMEQHYRADLSARYTLTPSILQAVYVPNFAKIESLHQQALAKAKDPAVRARLDMFGDNLKMLCFYLNEQGMLANAQDSAYYLSPGDFSAFMAEQAESLALNESWRQVKRRKLTPLEVRAFEAPATIAQPIERYSLRGAQDIVIYSPADGPIEVTFINLISRGQIIRYSVADSEGEILQSGIAYQKHKIKLDSTAGEHYFLHINGGVGSWEIATSAGFAVDATTSEKGLHFQGRATPIYFYVAPDTTSFSITLASAAPGETAVARIYDTHGDLAGTLRTVEVPAHRQTIQVGKDCAGIWKIAFEKADKGAFDDVYVEPGEGISGFFSLSGQAVLHVRRVTDMNSTK